MTADSAEDQTPTEKNGETSADEAAHRSRSARPTVDQLGELSFPASDPPAAGTWEGERPPGQPASPDHPVPEPPS